MENLKLVVLEEQQLDYQFWKLFKRRFGSTSLSNLWQKKKTEDLALYVSSLWNEKSIETVTGGIKRTVSKKDNWFHHLPKEKFR